jgi:hypothetical protein
MEFRWLTKVKVTFIMASQQKSLRDPCVAMLLGFGSNRRALHSLSHQNFGFAQDDRLTGGNYKFVRIFCLVRLSMRLIHW